MWGCAPTVPHDALTGLACRRQTRTTRRKDTFDFVPVHYRERERLPGWGRSLCRVEESVTLLAARTRSHEPSRCQSILPAMLLDARSSPAARARRNRSAQWHQRTSQRKRCRRQHDGCHMSMSRRTLSVARRWHAARSQYRPLRQLPCSAAAAAAADSSCDTLQLLSPCMELLRGRLQGVNESCQCCE